MGDIEKAFPSVESALRWADAMDHSGAKTLAAAYRALQSSLEDKNKENIDLKKLWQDARDFALKRESENKALTKERDGLVADLATWINQKDYLIKSNKTNFDRAEQAEAQVERIRKALVQVHCLLDGMVLKGKIDQHECRNTFQMVGKALSPLEGQE